MEKLQKFEDLTTYFQYIKDNKEDVIPWDIAGKNQTGGILGGYITSKKEYTAFNCASVGIYTDFWVLCRTIRQPLCLRM